MSKPDKLAKLAECPFCSGSARRSKGEGKNTFFGTGCATQKCPAELHALSYRTPQEADHAWNRRAGTTPVPVAAELTDALGMPLSCGKPLCSPGEHHPLCKLAAQHEMLWCIAIPGPDEHHAAPSENAAKHMAQRHNASMSDHFERNPDPEDLGPLRASCLAEARPWPWSAKEHADVLTSFDAKAWGWPAPEPAPQAEGSAS